MAKYHWPAGSTSKSVLLFIQDSASTTGAGRPSVSAGNIIASEIRVQTNNTVTRTTVSVTNLSALTDAYLAGGIFPVEPATCPGWYRFDIPNTALSTGAVTAAICIIGSLSASNIAQLSLEIQLQNVPSDLVAKAGITVSVSTLFPSLVRQWDATSVSSSNFAVIDASARIHANVQQWSGFSVSTNNVAVWSSISTANVTQWAGSATSVSDVAIQDTTDARFNVNVASWAGVSTSASNFALIDASTRINANVQQWAGASVTTNNIVLRTEISLSVVNVTAWAGVSTSSNDIALKDTLAAGTDITGTFNVNAVQWDGASTSAQDVALFDSTALFNALVGLAVNVTRWAGVSTSTNDIAILDTLAKTTHITGFNDVSKNSISAVVMGTALTESYAVDGSAFTLPQALYQVWARLSEFSISGQVITAFQLDGVTPAMTFSLDSATAPTKVERVT